MNPKQNYKGIHDWANYAVPSFWMGELAWLTKGWGGCEQVKTNKALNHEDGRYTKANLQTTEYDLLADNGIMSMI